MIVSICFAMLTQKMSKRGTFVFKEEKN